MMKRFALLALACFFSLAGHAQDKVVFLSEDSMTISVRVTSYAKNSAAAMANAEIAAIKTILFRGVPGSVVVKDAMVGTDEEAAWTNHAEYFDRLFSDGRYAGFIIANAPVSEFAKDETNQKRIVTDVQVNVTALKKDMENQGVIRHFGF